MSSITQMICNNFGGIRERNAVFSDSLVTAQDMQNVELYYTGVNDGVGIRTAKGNSSVCTKTISTNLNVYKYENSEYTSIANNGSITNEHLSFTYDGTTFENFVRDASNDVKSGDTILYYAWKLLTPFDTNTYNCDISDGVNLSLRGIASGFSDTKLITKNIEEEDLVLKLNSDTLPVYKMLTFEQDDEVVDTFYSSNTVLTTTSSNPNLVITNNYSGHKTSVGTQVVNISRYGNGVNKAVIGSSKAIKNGFLYKKYPSKYDEDGNWTDISSTLGIQNGKLYDISGETKIQIGNYTDWTKIDNQLCVRNGNLYAVTSYPTQNSSGVTSLVDDTTGNWTYLASNYVSSMGSNYYHYGIKDGYLYSITLNNGTYVISKITTGTQNKWTIISGESSPSHQSQFDTVLKYCYAINNGNLYRLNGNTATQVGSSNQWTYVSGTNFKDTLSSTIRANTKALGICNNNLYKIEDTTVTLIDNTKNWSMVSGEIGLKDDITDSSYYGFGITSDGLYQISDDNGISLKISATGMSYIGGGIFVDSSLESYKEFEAPIIIKNNSVYYVSIGYELLGIGKSYAYWTLQGSTAEINISNYGISVSGTPNDSDLLTLTYTTTSKFSTGDYYLKIKYTSGTGYKIQSSTDNITYTDLQTFETDDYTLDVNIGYSYKGRVNLPQSYSGLDSDITYLCELGLDTEKNYFSITDGTGIIDVMPIGESVKGMFSSVLNSDNYLFVYTESSTQGKLYSYDVELKVFTLIKSGLSLTGKSCGCDYAQGWTDMFVFSNGVNLVYVYRENNQFKTETDTLSNLTVYSISGGTATSVATGASATKGKLTATINNVVTTLYRRTGDDTVIDSTTYYAWKTGTTTYYTTQNMNVVLYDDEEREISGLGIVVFDNRLCIFKNNILWYSQKSNCRNFYPVTTGTTATTSAGYIEFGKNITAIYPYLGSLAVFHKDSSALVKTTSDTTTVFEVTDESPGGCASYNSLVFHGTDLYFYDDTKKGVFSFQQVVNGDKTLGDNIAINIQNILLNISDVDKIKTLSVVTDDRNEVWFLLPISTETGYSTTLIFDYLKGEWVKRKSQTINCITIYNSKLYSAGDKIYEEYNSSLFNGNYIQHYYNCSPLNLGTMNSLKILVFPPRASFDMPYNNQFYVKYIKNYNTFKTPKIRLIKAKLKNFLYWNIGKWNVNYWAGKNTSVIGKFPSATFKVLEICIYTENKTQDFAIRNIEFSKIKVKQV